jgi:hypothetical protein
LETTSGGIYSVVPQIIGSHFYPGFNFFAQLKSQIFTVSSSKNSIFSGYIIKIIKMLLSHLYEQSLANEGILVLNKVNRK